jgi:orotidine-5'-phosphate decarboxylase
MVIKQEYGMRELARKKLIVALDVSAIQETRNLVSALRDAVGMFKIGAQLFTAGGHDIVREIIRSGGPVFLDLKFHDIPNTVAAAGAEATRLGVSIFNVHAAGGREMMLRTAEAVSRTSDVEGISRPAVIAVTVLTSIDSYALHEIGTDGEIEEQVRRLALLAEASGMDGSVVSAREVRAVRMAVRKKNFLLVTPGVRPSGAKLNDQKRVMSPAQAIQAGADYVVVGRPITNASNPVRTAEDIIDEMASVCA